MSSVSRKEAKARFCQWRRERVTQEYHDRCGEKRATQGKNGGHLVGVNQDKKPRLTHNSSSQVAPSKSLSIPTVTQDDLDRFHITHFSNDASASTTAFFPLAQHEQNMEEDWQDDDEDDGLGYYPDGVKRKLTDEQIAIFRHSEVQTLLRERRGGQVEETKKKSGRRKGLASGRKKRGVGKGDTVSGVRDGGTMDGVESGDEDEEDEDEVEYMRFLKREREELNKVDEGVTHALSEHIELDYGDHHDQGLSDTAGPSDRNDIPAACHGRRIIVYEEEGDSAATTKKREFLWPKIGG